MLAADFGSGEALLSIFWFFMFFIWLWLLITVFSDLFRSHDLSGWAKALWVLFVVILPYLGVLLYLIVRGGKMAAHAQAAAEAQNAAAQKYIREAVGGSGGGAGGRSPAEELAHLAELKDKGVIDDAEFQTLKAKVVS
jgi:hypothetical protein